MAAKPLSLLARRRIQVRGVVQGVGFRPFVYNLAQRLRLVGFVLNSSSGVIIELQGDEADIEQFLHSLTTNPPPLAQIEDMRVDQLEANGDAVFAIQESQCVEGEFALVAADVGTCKDCWSDFSDPANRRYLYAFTNCTNCGPRYTIVQDVPYDRPATTMSSFRMCKQCQAEYDDPRDRRFHAQPNACPVCGPQLTLAKSGDTAPAIPADLTRVRKLLREGNIVAVKGLGGFLLACDAENDSAVRLLRQRKRRSDKPFALMARDIPSIERFCAVSNADRTALSSPRRPIVIMPRREPCSISSEVAPGNKYLGVMLPYSPLHYLLFSDSADQVPEFPALVMTSGNFSEEPIVISNEDAAERLRPVADWFLFHDRDIYMRVDDSVVRTFENRQRVIRRARGFAPEVINLGHPVEEVLACGAELKNTFCLTKGHYAILSQHIGDLENYDTLLFFQETLDNLKKVYRAHPSAVAHDLHPQYMSTRFAQNLELDRKIGVQHHHAHVASCMAENQLRDKVIGIAFDGTGYGTDGQIWGGEFLIADFASFERYAHFRYVDIPGGDAAIRQPWRMAMSYLRDCFGTPYLTRFSRLFDHVPEKQVAIVDNMLARRINTVRTSSCGRLFDAVASLAGIRQHITFEGQAAVALEMAASEDVSSCYPFEVHDVMPVQIDVRPMICAIVDDVSRSLSPASIAARFHNTMARIMLDVALKIRKEEKIDRVCLSGGTFQNHYLLKWAVQGLRKHGFEVFLHSTVPTNDGGISLGQAVIANELLRHGG